ncbi:hypothetical protein [Streptococcus sp. sy010]|uniref:hypothetical protein n=1 Tax=Streptococcus sp. sy010 TaxID=2600148 RepID=UPI0011B93047|nr:hypothetical protein [Streptococcus sp. sy010]TWT16535.1 hypothetical protein FRX51_01090 [Streptococcus sp. sy010]
MKLVKYELKSVGRWYLGLYALCLAMAFALRRLTPEFQALGQSVSLSNWLYTVYSFSAVVTFLLIVAMMIATIFIICHRFRQELFGRQAYLTLTLPVSTHQILMSKLLVSLFLASVNALIIFIGLGIGFEWLDRSMWAVLWGEMTTINWMLSLIQWVLSISREILTIYLAVAVGHLFRNRQILMSFLTYFLLVVVMSLVTNFLGTVLVNELSYWSVMSLFSLLCIGIYYGMIHFIIKNRLNLQ